MGQNRTERSGFVPSVRGEWTHRARGRDVGPYDVRRRFVRWGAGSVTRVVPNQWRSMHMLPRAITNDVAASSAREPWICTGSRSAPAVTRSDSTASSTKRSARRFSADHGAPSITARWRSGCRPGATRSRWHRSRNAVSTERGVVAVGPVGTRWAGRFRIFRYEVRRWRDGVIPDLHHAIGGPVRLTDDAAVAEHILESLPLVPVLTWGRDEAGVGEMWSCNSIIAWVLSRAAVDTARDRTPASGTSTRLGCGNRTRDQDPHDVNGTRRPARDCRRLTAAQSSSAGGAASTTRRRAIPASLACCRS